jgi:uncharacterized protein YcbK (DUF882 family)
MCPETGIGCLELEILNDQNFDIFRKMRYDTLFRGENTLKPIFIKQKHKNTYLLRRDFLKLGLIVTGAALNPFSALADLNSHSKPFKNLAFYNIHTNERLHVCYSRNGSYDIKALSRINHILRDHRSGEVKAIDTQLLELLHALSHKTNPQKPFHVISGYRSPATNKKLRKTSKGVASSSLHMQGKAIDIRIPGFRTRQLRNVARKLKVGGVGYYSKSDFVHVDIGRVRYW